MEINEMQSIKIHDFEKAKEAIKELSEKMPEEMEFPAVKEEGDWFGWGDHNVTGKELNEVTSMVQKHCMEDRKMHQTVLTGFKYVYEALKAVDADYISGILLAVEGAKRANDQAKGSQDKVNKVQKFQKNSTVELTDYKKTVDVKLEKYKKATGRKLKIAYAVAGVSLLLTVVQLALILLGVL